MLSYVLPTHNRPQRLKQTLEKIGRLNSEAHELIGGAEVMVIDNASSPALCVPETLPNGFTVRVICRQTNEGAAARNVGVEQARGEWIVMLDDDSYPINERHIEVVMAAESKVAAIGGDIRLSNGRRESGGLPEVFVGCGVLIRRSAFLAVGGYDPAFDYYAEEYDLCAKLILNGWRITHNQRFCVMHEKTTEGRDMNRIVQRLVRNNGWVMQRYAPDEVRNVELAQTITRYSQIAIKENAGRGFANGVAELLQTLHCQPRSEMSHGSFERFTGLAHVRSHLRKTLQGRKRLAIAHEGKNCGCIRKVLQEFGVQIVESDDPAEAVMIGSLSPGPMLDAHERHRHAANSVMLPWSPNR